MPDVDALLNVKLKGWRSAGPGGRGGGGGYMVSTGGAGGVRNGAMRETTPSMARPTRAVTAMTWQEGTAVRSGVGRK
eukprot:355299-Chlamydomonas_euryale.AAC.1